MDRLVSCIRNASTCFVIVFICQACVITVVSSQVIFVSNNATTEKRQSVQLTCKLGPEESYYVEVYRTPTTTLSSANRVARCFHGYCRDYHTGYKTTADAYGRAVYVNISSLDRAEDEKFWTCRNMFMSKPKPLQMFLTVYTTPTAAFLSSSFTESHSLSYGPAFLTCRTDICTYKDPVLKWYFMVANGSKLVFELGETTSWDSDVSCNDSEKIYYSKLSLRENMTFSANADMTVHVVCSISFPTLADELISLPSGNVSFAVQITSVTIHDENQEMSDNSIITVTENVSYNVICKPGPSRPPPIYLLYVGKHIVQEAKVETLTFIPNRNQHGDKIYCSAYNLKGPENAVVSKKANLFVNIPVSRAVLRDGNQELKKYSFLNVSEGFFKTLSCITNESRPPANVVWYIDNKIRQSLSNTSFTFKPKMGDHNKNIYCAAYNIPGIQPLESSKPMLQVIGRPLPPLTFLFTGSYGYNATFYWIAGYNGGYTQSFLLQYRIVGEIYWTNNTHFAEIPNQEAESPLPEYTAQISNLTPEVYQARLIARNTHGEASPVNIMGSTFQIAKSISDTFPLAQSSTPVITTGTIMGCTILVLIGITVYQFISFKRRRLKSSATTEIKLENIPGTSTETPSIYEDLKTVEETTGSAYGAFETPAKKNASTGLYENLIIK